ncbi:hypothetical protein [Streptomyces microflavus]|uniref:hypothetical protein n=1 Tax=Streptomyces microflavus TaxID=1919 RepID=UPI00367BF4EF
MTRAEALCALIFAFLLIAAGVVWLFGPYGLVGAGVVGGAAVSAINIKGEGDGDG